MANRLPGRHVGADLEPQYAGPTNTIPSDLGADSGYVPPDPPEPAYRGVRVATGMPWRPRDGDVRVATDIVWRDGVLLRAAAAVAWRGPVDQVGTSAGIVWGQPEQIHTAGLALAWTDSQPRVRRDAALPWAMPAPVRGAPLRLPWGETGPSVRHAIDIAFRYSTQQRKGAGLAWGEMQQLARDIDLPWALRASLRRAWRLPWGEGQGLPWVVTPPGEPPPEPLPPGRISGRFVGANLGCPVWTGPASHIPANLGVLACYNVRPRRPTVVIVNDISVVRLPERTPINVGDGDIGMDVGSWAKTFSMNPLTADDFALLKAGTDGPREIEITINGHVFTFIVEDRGVDKRFVQHRFVVSGRSRTALLSAPYATPRTKVEGNIRTAAQLVDDELADTGFTADYATVDWNVPAGAWSYAETTAIDAIVRIAEASGAVVQSDPEDKVLRIVPRYPASPWDWTVTSPDVTVLDDLAVTVNTRESHKPMYNKVFVSSEQLGVMGFFRRTGSGGGIYAPQAVHPLISNAVVHAERGRNVLSDRGTQHDVAMQLPLFASPVLPGQQGLLLPLQLAEVAEGGTTYLGLVTSNRISWSRDDARLTVWQTANIERHPGDAN